MVKVMETITNVRVEFFGGLPHQPIVVQRVCIGGGRREPDPARGESGAAKDHPGRGERDQHARDTEDGRPDRALEQARDASERGEERERRAPDQKAGTASSLALRASTLRLASLRARRRT
jgi:hypothetical protein